MNAAANEMILNIYMASSVIVYLCRQIILPSMTTCWVKPCTVTCLILDTVTKFWTSELSQLDGLSRFKSPSLPLSESSVRNLPILLQQQEVKNLWYIWEIRSLLSDELKVTGALARSDYAEPTLSPHELLSDYQWPSTWLETYESGAT